jgi:hypothetical protein
MDLTGRHPSTVSIARYFAFEHLPEPQRSISATCSALKDAMIAELPDGPELTTGLRKLLEAKDCFVRASLPTERVVGQSQGESLGGRAVPVDPAEGWPAP